MTISAKAEGRGGDLLARALDLYRDLSVALKRTVDDLSQTADGGKGHADLIRSHQKSLQSVLELEASFGQRSQAPAEGSSSTSTPHGPKSVRDLLGGLPIGEWDAFLDELSANALLSLPWLFEHWALEGHQLPPGGDWTTWVVIGGRGAGKTRAGSEWVRAQVEGSRPGDPGRCSRVALVGETIDQAREVMVFGESGHPGLPRRRTAAGVAGVAQAAGLAERGGGAGVFGERPGELRGPQFDAAWADELAKWTKGEEAWDMLQFALRLGERPRAVVTTTPRGTPLLQAILKIRDGGDACADRGEPDASGAKSFLEQVTAKYGGSRLGRQELDGEMLFDVRARSGRRRACWTKAPRRVEVDRIVVAVDPPVTSGSDADECGIVVVGAATQGPPQDWVGRGAGGRQPERARARRPGRSGRWRSSASTRRTGWWPRSTRAASSSRAWCAGSTPSCPIRGGAGEPGQGGAGRAGGGALRAGAGGACRHVPAARGPDAGDDGAGVSRAGLARPARRAGLGADRSDDRAGEQLAVAAGRAARALNIVRGGFAGRASQETRMVLQYFRSAKPVPPETKASAAARVVPIHGIGRASWSARDSGTLTRVGFLGNPVGFRCVKLIAEAAAAVPVVVQDAERRFEAHPVLELFGAPNPGQGGAALFESLYGS
jgi:phage terminase large subunit-like protein